MSATCTDCWLASNGQAAGQDWPAFTANCQGCMDRALAVLQTLPPIEPPPKPTEEPQ